MRQAEAEHIDAELRSLLGALARLVDANEVLQVTRLRPASSGLD